MMKTSYRKLKRWIAISGLLLMLPCLVDAQTITYEWYRGSTQVGSGATFTENSTLSAGSYTYYRKAIYNGQSLQTTPFTVTVYGNFNAGAIPTTGQTICSGEMPTAITQVTLPTGGDGSYTYQWYDGATAISGATAAGYAPLPLTATKTYTRRAMDGTCQKTLIASTGSYVVTVKSCWSNTAGWSMSDDCTSCTWQEAKDKCKSLGMRLPNDSDWGALPENSNVLGLTDSYYYWSATELDSSNANLWYWSNSSLNGPYLNYKGTQYLVRCVNDWSRSDDCTSCTWQQAKDKCASLGMRLPDNSDWGALPKNSNVLGLTDNDYYWSATENDSDNANICYWSTHYGSLDGPGDLNKTSQNRVRCVRN